MKRVGVGIIGTGMIAEQHVTAIEHLGGLGVLIAACDANPARLTRFGERHFFPFACQNPSDLIDRKDVDLVIVATPPSTHETLTSLALQHGKHVVCEKPLAHHLAAADRIHALASEHLGKLSVCYQMRFDHNFKRIHWLLQQPAFGRVHEIECRRCSPAPPRAISKGWWGKWDVAGGGTMMTQLIHNLDLVCHLLGRPEWVEAKMSNTTPGLESEDTCKAKVRFSNQIDFRSYCSLHGDPSDNFFRIHGDFGTLELPWERTHLKPDLSVLAAEALDKFPGPSGESRFRNLLRRATNKGFRKIRSRIQIPGPHVRNSHFPYLKAILEAIKQSQPLPLGPEENRMSMELVTAIYAAAIDRERKYFPIPLEHAYYRGGIKSHWTAMHTSKLSA